MFLGATPYIQLASLADWIYGMAPKHIFWNFFSTWELFYGLYFGLTGRSRMSKVSGTAWSNSMKNSWARPIARILARFARSNPPWALRAHGMTWQSRSKIQIKIWVFFDFWLIVGANAVVGGLIRRFRRLKSRVFAFFAVFVLTKNWNHRGVPTHFFFRIWWFLIPCTAAVSEGGRKRFLRLFFVLRLVLRFRKKGAWKYPYITS